MAISSLRRMLRQLGLLALSVFVFLGPAPASAQNSTDTLSGPQLEQLLAPIALYPDSLLSQVLMASTYPLEVVEAARWAKDNQGVTGQALEDAMQKQTWDPSVRALTSVPQTLEMMNDKLSWTQQLGDAFLGQQEDVLAAVQRLRARADANGFLKSNDKQTVTRAASPPGGAAPASGSAASAGAPAPVFTIEPAVAGQYAVPIYDPNVVYGTWPYPDYAPFYWAPPAYAGYGALAFTTAALTGAAIWGGVDWWRRSVNVNVNNFNRFNRTNIANANWTHNPGHRGAVPYRGATAQRFGNQSKAAARDAFRGKADAGRRDMAGQNKAGQNAGAAKAAANRGAGTKQAGRGNRAAGAKQAGVKQGAAKQAHTKQAGQGNRGGGAKQAKAGNARSAQGARSKQASQAHARQGAARPQASAARGGAHRPNMAHAGGMSRPAAMRGGGGHRGGGGFRGGGRRR